MAEEIILADENELPPPPQTETVSKVEIAKDDELPPLKKKELTEKTTTSSDGGVFGQLRKLEETTGKAVRDLGITEAELSKDIEGEKLSKQIKGATQKFRESQIGADRNLNYQTESEKKRNRFEDVLSNVKIQSLETEKALTAKARQIDEVKAKIENPNTTQDEKSVLMDEHDNLVNEYKSGVDQLTELDKKHSILEKGIKAVDTLSDKETTSNPFESAVKGVSNLAAIAYNNSIPTIVRGADYLLADVLDLNANPLAKATNGEDYIQQWADYFRSSGDKLAEEMKLKADADYTDANIFEKDENGNYANLTNPKAYINFAGQMLGNIATTAAAGYTGGAGAAYLSGVAQTMPEVYNEAKNVFGDAQKAALFALPVSMIAGAFEEAGAMPMVDNITKKQLLKEATKEIIEKSANQKLTPELLQKLFTESLANSAKKYSGKAIQIAKEAGKEGASEAAESITTDLSKIATDVFRGEDEKKFGTTYKDLANNAFENAIGGFVAGAPLSVISNVDDNQKTEIANLAHISANDVNHYNEVIAGIKQLQQEGKISDKTANDYIVKYDKLVKADKKIPTEIQGVKRADANELIQEKESLKEQIKDKDDALIQPQKERIKVIDEQLRQIANPEAIKEGETINSLKNESISKESGSEKSTSEESSGQGLRQNEEGRKSEVQNENGREGLLTPPAEEATAPVSPIAESDVLSKFQDAVNLYDEIQSTESGTKKRRLAEKRRKFMDENPSIKYIDDNISNIYSQLEDKKLITKKGNCP